MINYVISFKGTTSRMTLSDKLRLDEHSDELKRKMYDHFTQDQLKNISRSNQYVEIDDSGEEVRFIVKSVSSKVQPNPLSS